MPQRRLTDLFLKNVASQHGKFNTCGKPATMSKIHGSKEVSIRPRKTPDINYNSQIQHIKQVFGMFEKSNQETRA